MISDVIYKLENTILTQGFFFPQTYGMKHFGFYSFYKQKSMQSNKKRKNWIANRPIFFLSK